jgi:oxygen-dependent protoporphyrinogen oxidase
VGGGITGLATAWWLREFRPDVKISLIEAGEQLGGVLKTDHIDGYLIERSADMFSTENESVLDLVERLGRKDELVTTIPVAERAYVATDNATQPWSPVPNGFSLMLPANVQSVVDSDLLNDQGKIRFLAERDVPPKLDNQDESVEAFAVRRFGQQVFDRLIQPLVSGIYTADPKRLSMQATMSRFLDLERRYGSLIRAAAELKRLQSFGNDSRPGDTPAGEKKLGYGQNRLAGVDQTASGARYELFRAPRRGMGQLVEWIESNLRRVEIIKPAKVVTLGRRDRCWRIIVETKMLDRKKWSAKQWAEPRERTQQELLVDAVVICSSAKSAASLVEPLAGIVAAELREIETASCAVVVLGLEKRQLLQEFESYGIVVPACLNRPLIAVSCASNKFPDRCPGDRMLFRCFLGGALQPEMLQRPDSELLEIAGTELKRLLPFVGESKLARVYRWTNAMPQYHLDHMARVDRIQARIRELPGLELAGNSYNGVGIPVCVSEGKEAAQRIVDYLTRNP